MADTVSSSSRLHTTDSDQDVEAMYNQATELGYEQGQDEPAAEPETDAPTPTDTDSDASQRSHGPIGHTTARDKAEIAQMGETSITRIEQLRAENVEHKAETHRLRQEIASLRERNRALERANFKLDEKVSELATAEKRIVELQHSVDYHRTGRKAMYQEVRRLQDNLAESEKRFGHTEAQLRAICQERSDRITVLSEELRAVQRAKAELEQQVETLLGYRQRAMSCLQQLTEELQRLRKENREKSRRLSESRAILRSIDQRLAQSMSEPI